MTNEQKVKQAQKNLQTCKQCKFVKKDKQGNIFYQINIIKQKFFVSNIRCINPKCGCGQTVSLLNGNCPRDLF